MSDNHDPSPRMREFQSEVDALKVRGGRSNPERTWLRLGTVGMVVAIAIEIAAYVGSHGTTDALSQRDYIVVALIGVAVAIVSAALFITYSLTRYLRYWLIRLIYQDRESTDRIIDSLDR